MAQGLRPDVRTPRLTPGLPSCRLTALPRIRLIDEVSIHLVPVLFGSGTPLFGNLDNKHIPLEPVEVIETAEVTHLRFHVVK